MFQNVLVPCESGSTSGQEFYHLLFFMAVCDFKGESYVHREHILPALGLRYFHCLNPRSVLSPVSSGMPSWPCSLKWTHSLNSTPSTSLLRAVWLAHPTPSLLWNRSLLPRSPSVNFLLILRHNVFNRWGFKNCPPSIFQLNEAFFCGRYHSCNYYYHYDYYYL